MKKVTKAVATAVLCSGLFLSVPSVAQDENRAGTTQTTGQDEDDETGKWGLAGLLGLLGLLGLRRRDDVDKPRVTRNT